MAAMVMLFSLAQAACPSLDEVLTLAATELQDVHLDAVHADLQRAHAALSCGEPATPTQIARLWLIEGVTALVENDPTTAADALEAVARIQPSVFEDVYGPRVAAAFEEAQRVVPGRANLVIEPIPPGSQRWVDGTAVGGGAPVTSGLHVIQVSDASGAVQFGQVLFLESGQLHTAQTGLSVVVEPPPVAPIEKRRIRAVGWAAVAGVALAGGVGTYVYSTTQNRGYREATGYDELDRARNRQVGAATATYGLGGIAAAAGAVFVARQF